jgi:LuxR family maltose regulon positive regulatory protein
MILLTNLKNSKIYRPLKADNYIHRQNLTDQLNQFAQRQATLISAPAGYGKSTLVNSWLDTIGHHHVAWVSLDKNDDDLRQFLNYTLFSLSSAVEKDAPDAFMVTMDMVKAISVPSISTLCNSISQEVNAIEQSVILVLDDFQFIKDNSVIELVNELLNYPSQKLHLMLICRRDPPLPISKLRAGNLLTEIRAQDLRFNKREIKLFLEQELATEVASSIVAQLEEKTEGWITGLRLAVTSMQHRGGELDPKLLELQVGSQYVMEYLFDEVFCQQSLEVRKNITKIAILDRFCGPLCEAVCLANTKTPAGERDGWGIVARLQDENAFLISLDSANQWFRFHHLFQKFLQNQLRKHATSEDIAALHIQASRWFAENDLIEDALKHSLAGGDIETAEQLVEKDGLVLMDRQDWHGLERSIRMLPCDRVDQNPTLLMYLAWHNHMQYSGHDLTAMAGYLDRVEKLLNKLSPNALSHLSPIKGHYEALCGFQALIFADAKKGMSLAESACKNIPNQHKRARVFANIFRTAAYQMVGDIETGVSIYNNEMAKEFTLDNGHYIIYLMNLCHIYWINGDLQSIKRNAERALAALPGQQMPESVSAALYFLGVACYHQNDLKIAEEKLTMLVNDFFFINVIRSTHGSIALALVHQAKGENDRMEEVLKVAMDHAIDVNNQAAIKILKAFEAERAVQQGRIAEASEWASGVQVKPIMLPFLFYWPHLTLVKVLLAQDTTDSLLQADHLLDQLEDYLASIHNRRFMIDTLALQALIHKKRGNMEVARGKIHAALELAEIGQFVRCLNNLGPLLSDVIRQESKQNYNNLNFISQVLTVFVEDDHIAVSQGSDKTLMSLQLLPEPLTNRELDVLNLLADRLQNKDIAVRLSISTETVKSHLKLVFRKLGATNRQNAVFRAVALGILSEKS